ncbi:MAG: hypothetical protein FWD83_10855, partial [Promicromonosporaceae bacterium]|nr:hypothetical protein [Promicromonosporaceae bacterium]
LAYRWEGWAQNGTDHYSTTATNAWDLLVSTCEQAQINAAATHGHKGMGWDQPSDYRVVLVGTFLGNSTSEPGRKVLYNGLPAAYALLDALQEKWPELQENLTSAKTSQPLAEYRFDVYQIGAQYAATLEGRVNRVCVVMNRNQPAFPTHFQPKVTTDASPQTIRSQGQTVTDQVTFGVHNLADGTVAEWPEGTPVRATGTLYGPLARNDQPMPGGGLTAPTIPAGTPVVGTVLVERSSPGTVTSPGLTVNLSGYYTWVWRIDKADQPSGTAEKIEANYYDGFLVASETFPVKMELDIWTEVSASLVAKGQGVTDKVCLGLTSPGALWLAPGGTPLAVPVIVEAVGPHARVGQAPGAVVATQTLTFTQAGCQDVTFPGTVFTKSGHYFARASISPAISSSVAQYLANPKLTDGDWAANENWAVKMELDIATRVASPVVAKGGSVMDQVCLTMTTPGDVWLETGGAALSIPVIVEAVGPHARVGQAPNAVVATQTLTFTQAGCQDVTFPGTVFTKSGHYFARASISPAISSSVAQYLQNPKLTDGDWAANENWAVKMELDVHTQIAAPVTSKGEAVTDQVCLTMTTPGDLWLEIDGAALSIPVTVEAVGPHLRIGDAPGAVVATQMLTFTKAGCLSVTFPGTAFTRSGHYFARASISPTITPATSQYLANPKLTDGDWAANENWVVRLTPQITTVVASRVYEERDLPVEVTDSVTVTIPAGDLWFEVGGKPIEMTVRNDLHGPFDVPDLQRDNITSVEAAQLVASRTLTFTKPGTQETAPITIDRQADAMGLPDKVTGFYTWESQIAAATYIDGFDSDFWIEAETFSIRDEIFHYSRTHEANAVPGGRLYDDVLIGQLRANHGEFDGLGGWVADNQFARLSVYLTTTEPEDGQVVVPANVVLFDSVTAPAANGRYQFGYGDLGLARIPKEAPLDAV